MRPHQVWRHRLGTPQSDDVLVVAEPDERFFLGVDSSRDEAWIVITAESKQSTEVWVVPAAEPMATPRSVAGRRADHEYSVEPWGDRFVIVTNDDAEDFRVVTAPIDAPGEWTELVAHEPGRRVTAVEAFAGHLVIHEWANAQPRLRVLFRDGSERVVDTGDEPSDVEFDANPEYDTTTLRYSYQSLTTPASVYETDVTTGERRLLKQTPVLGVDLSQYESARIWAPAPDGTSVPLDVVRRRDTPIDGTAPALLYGYGSYEASMPPWFSAARLSLLDRGWVWALAHPRGGGELGRRWYLDGKLMNKRNTFDDFLACADHLVALGYAAPDRVAVRGGSAGGLLVGAAMTLRPDSINAVIAEVPFVDVISSMSDPSLPLTITEWEEWGDPRQEPAASYMLAYSPYDNVAARAYPALYVTAGLNDPRVSFHEPAKWVAKLRAVGTGSRPLLLRTEMGAGHGGPSGRYDAWRDEAQVLAFLLTVMGAATDRPRPIDERHRVIAMIARPTRTALRTTLHGPIGRVEKPPKQAHGGRRPSASRRTSSAVNTSSNAAVSAATSVPRPLDDEQRAEADLDPRHHRHRPRRGAEPASVLGPGRAGELPATGDEHRDAEEHGRGHRYVHSSSRDRDLDRQTFGGSEHLDVAEPAGEGRARRQLVDRRRRCGWDRGGTAQVASRRTRPPATARTRRCNGPSSASRGTPPSCTGSRG